MIERAGHINAIWSRGVPSPCLALVGEGDEEGEALLGTDAAGDVAFAGDVFGEHDRAGADAAHLAVAGLDLGLAGEGDDELAARRRVPVDELVGRRAPEDHADGRVEPRELRLRVLLLQLDVDVLEMTLAVLVGIDPEISHRVALLSSPGDSCR